MSDFFDKMREQINAGLTKVTTKSRVTVETTRLGGQVRRITKEKEEALLRLGTQVYQEISANGHLYVETVQEDLKRIQAMDREIADVQKEIERLEALDAATPWAAKEEEKPIAICTCGAPLTEDTRFCGNCGINAQEIIVKAKAEELARAEAAKRTTVAVCLQCGTEVTMTAKFCRSCGAAVNETREPTAEPQITPCCPHCGSTITSTAKFCRSCGKAMTAETPSATIQEGAISAQGGETRQGIESILDSLEKRDS
jgi:ribosomal protein L40E